MLTLAARGARLVHRASYFASIAAAILSTLIAFALVAEVTAREVVGQSIPGVHEAVRTLLVAIVFLAVPFGEQTGTHVRVTLLTGRLPTRIQSAVRAAALGAALYIVALMLQFSFARAQESYAMGEHVFSIVRFPIWPARWIIVLGLTLLTLELAIKVIEYALSAWRGAVRTSAAHQAVGDRSVGA